MNQEKYRVVIVRLRPMHFHISSVNIFLADATGATPTRRLDRAISGCARPAKFIDTTYRSLYCTRILLPIPHRPKCFVTCRCLQCSSEMLKLYVSQELLGTTKPCCSMVG
ncbi:unnamed protein product [Arctia plantaginis]|uniref:Uncharacterized protein n=1 Tax=Arctia plantaginis TaxID=874455 RepID=A0A8S1ADZ1_ARCPL|nr:unnamed protein product [Arctia plantaginis]